MSQVVDLRFFGGLSVEETAEVLKVSPETVMRDWKTAKVWLLRELGRAVGTEQGMPYLVTELLEGATLRERLRSGPIPQSKAIDYACQGGAGSGGGA